MQNAAVDLALGPERLVDRRDVDADLNRGGRRRGRGERRLAERQRRVQRLGKPHGVTVALDVHVDGHRRRAQQVVVERGDLQARGLQL